jgi:hypothetical protein
MIKTNKKMENQEHKGNNIKEKRIFGNNCKTYTCFYIHKFVNTREKRRGSWPGANVLNLHSFKRKKDDQAVDYDVGPTLPV